VIVGACNYDLAGSSVVCHRETLKKRTPDKSLMTLATCSEMNSSKLAPHSEMKCRNMYLRQEVRYCGCSSGSTDLPLIYHWKS